MFFRLSLANATAEQVAQIGQTFGVAGTVFSGIGFGSWGIESTVVVELGGVTRAQVEAFAAAIFAAFPAEQAVYVVEGDGVGQVWFRDGRVE